MTAGLMGAGKGADFFQQAIKQVSADLSQAQAASKAANEALADGNDKYKELEKAANKAVKAAEKLAIKGELDPATAQTAINAARALDGYSHTLKSLEQNAAAATKKEEQFAKSLKNVQQLSAHTDKSLAGQAENTEKLRGALASVPGPLGKIGSAALAPVQGFQKLSASVGSSNAAMLLGATAAAGIVLALVAVAAAAVYATVKVAAWAVGLADSARNAALTQQAVEAMNPAIAAASPLFAALTDETGLGAAELDDLTKSLTKAKVSAANMPAALRAAALAERALGKGGSAEFVAQLEAGKVAASALSAEVSGKLGPIVAKQMRGLGAQSEKFKSNVSSLFGGLNIEPVLDGMQRLVALFDKNTVAGQTIKFLFESIFQPLIDQADHAAIVIEAFALGFLIGLTKVYIAVKPAIKAVKEFFGFDDSSLSDTLDVAKVAGEAVAYVFVGFVAALAAVGAVIGIVVGQVFVVTGVIAALAAGVVAAGVMIYDGFVSAWHAVVDFFSTLSLASIGTNIINGLIDGVVNMGPNFLNAITGVVGGAIKAVKSLLGIHSPSTVFAAIGDNTMGGYTEGVEEAAPEAQAATAAAMDPTASAAKLDALSGNLGAATASAAPAPAPASAASGGASVNLAGATFNLYGVEGAEDAERRIGELLTKIMQGDAASLGAEMAPA